MILPAALIALGVACVGAYAPGLGGKFVFDSVERVSRNESLHMKFPTRESLWRAAFAGQGTFPERGLAYVSFALNNYLSGGRASPRAFKLTNLLVHLINGLLVFFLARFIIRTWAREDSSRAPDTDRTVWVYAFGAAGLWLLHPIQLTGVLYVVQRMTSLSATFVFSGLVVFLYARQRLQDGRAGALAGMYAAIFLSTICAYLSKQNGALLPAFALLLEIFLFRRDALAAPTRQALLWFYGFTVLAPVVLVLVLLLVAPDHLMGGYKYREFDAYERVLTQSRVLFFYLKLLTVPNIRDLGLYHDDIVTSTGLFSPLSTGMSVLAWVIILALVAWGTAHRFRWAFGILWFLVGHSIESTILPLEQVFEHRNYLPSTGIWITVAWYARLAARRSVGVERLVAPVIVACLLVLTFLTHVRATYWQDPATLMEWLTRNHPRSYRSVLGAAYNSVPPEAALSVRFEAFRRAAVLNPGVVTPLVEMVKIAESLRIALERMAPPTRPSLPPSREPTVETMRLFASAAQVKRLLIVLDGEINRRLRGFAVRTDSIVSLVSMVDCVRSGMEACAGLYEEARRWHIAALSNERTSSYFKGVLELSLAKLLLTAGEAGVIEHARRGGRLVGHNLSHRIVEASIYASLGRWREVSRVLTEVEQQFPDRVWTEPGFRILHAEAALKREQGTSR